MMWKKSDVCYPDDAAEMLLSNELVNDDDDDEADLMERGVSEFDICDAWTFWDS